MLLNFRGADGDIREMVADPFQLPEHFNENHTRLDSAFAGIAALDMGLFISLKES